MAERLNETKLTKRFGNRVYVSTVMVETLFPATDERIFNVEDGLARLAQKHRDLDRKVTGHGARLAKVEKQHELTRDYLQRLQALE